MRNKIAKKLKKEVALKLYVGDGVTKEDVLKDKKSVYKSSDFKKIWRARKKNYLKTYQHPNLKTTNRHKRLTASGLIKVYKLPKKLAA